MSAPILYFGCLGDAGHYLRDKTKPHHAQPRYSSTAWGNQLDGGIFADSKRHWEDGVVHHAQKDGWSVVYWADYSVDTRPGSHSTFVVQALMTKDELIAAARLQWPEVFGRKRFPRLT